MRTPFMVALLGIAWLALTLIAVTAASAPWRVVLTVAAAVYGYAYGWTLRDSEIEGGE